MVRPSWREEVFLPRRTEHAATDRDNRGVERFDYPLGFETASSSIPFLQPQIDRLPLNNDSDRRLSRSPLQPARRHDEESPKACRSMWEGRRGAATS